MKTITLTHEKVAFVDDCDYDYLSQFEWRSYQHHGIFYAYRNCPITKKSVQMHHEILKPVSGFEIDHKDHNGLNNQRDNLRLATRMQNQQNRKPHKFYAKHPVSSQFKGVYWNRDARKWHVQIVVNKQRQYLGQFDSEIEAAMAYDRAALKYFGVFAQPNIYEQLRQKIS